jgi:hypothetical protein
MFSVSSKRVLRCIILTVVLTGMLSCAPSSVPSATSDPVQAGIQRTLDRYVQAYDQNDEPLLQRLIDPSNRPFRRFIVTRFEAFQSSSQHGQHLLPLHVLSIEPRTDGFMLAHIQASDTSNTNWLFRQIGTDWLLTEPTVEQIGKPKHITHGRFTFVTYPWADDVNARIITLMDQAQQQVVNQLGKDASQPVTIDIKPIYGLTPFENSFYVAYYSPAQSNTKPDRIEVFAPNSYLFGFYDPTVGWEQSLQTTLTHEYTHMVHMRAFKNVGYLTTWMPEGLAEYIAHNANAAVVGDAVRAGTIIPIIDKQSPVYKQDLMHMTTLEKDRGLSYGLAQSLVRYIIEEHGGLPAFWSLAAAYDESQNLDKALQKSLHLSYDAFDQGWRAWLEATY